MNARKIINALAAASFVLCISSAAMGTENCPGGHCSNIAPEMNKFCIANGMSGLPYLVFAPDGGMCYCPCSCVTADTQLTSIEHELRAISESAVGDELYSPLSPDQRGSIDTRLRSEIEGALVLRVRFSSGAILTASTNHTLILPDETVAAIDGLQVGDQVLGQNWTPVTITDIERIEDFNGELHNAIVNGSSAAAKDHLVVTNGILSGDWLLQANNDAVERSISLRTGTLDLFERD